MNEISLLPASQEPESPKHSRLGIASFLLALIAVLLIGVVYSYEDDWTFGMVGSFSSFVLSLAGLGLGIAAVVRKNARRTYGIIGIVINLLVLPFSSVVVLIPILFWLACSSAGGCF